MRRLLLSLLACSAIPGALADTPRCETGLVWADRNHNGQFDPGEQPIAGVKVSDGRRLVSTDAQGRYSLPLPDSEGGTLFVVKPAGYDFPRREDGLPAFWINDSPRSATELKYGGIPIPLHATPNCKGFPLLPRAKAKPNARLDVLLFADTQTKSRADIDYYRRDIIEPLAGKHQATLGLTLGDVVNDDCRFIRP